MARARNIKPGFCQNEHLAELPVETRLLFALLPMFADRDGRLEDRPKRIGVQVFPYDGFDTDAMLQQLHDSGFVLRYSVDNSPYIQIVNFSKHQNPHVKEAASNIPAPDKPGTSTGQVPDKSGSSHADSLNPITDSLKEKPRKRAPAKTRLAETELPDDWRDYCQTKRPDLDPDTTFDNFRDYWIGHGKPMADWRATWQRWVRNENTRPQSRAGTVRETNDERRAREADEHRRRILAG